MSTPVVTAVIAEDEEHARQSLRDYLTGASWVRLVGEAKDGAEAVEMVDRLQPDLLFLDVRLPELSGLEVARRIRHAPEIVFTTAYDRFALAAFELGALDYLLKPFGEERFRATLERVRSRLRPTSSAPAVERARIALEEGPVKRFFARSGDRIVPIPAEEIRRIQARGDYAEVHASGGEFLLRVTLAELAARLDPDRFRQVHRSHIVNLDAVRHLRRYDDRRLLVVLKDGTEIVASRAASEELRRSVK
jgi:two-component system LytT family response regulator